MEYFFQGDRLKKLQNMRSRTTRRRSAPFRPTGPRLGGAARAKQVLPKVDAPFRPTGPRLGGAVRAKQVLPKVDAPFRGAARTGQATVEFILILLVSVSYIVAIIQPNADAASNSIEDVAAIGKISVSAQKISNAVQYVSVSGAGTRQAIQIVVPPAGIISCEPQTDSTSIKFTYTLKSGRGIAACEGDGDGASANCTRSIAVGPKFTCTPATLAPGIYSASISKNPVGNITAGFSVVQ